MMKEYTEYLVRGIVDNPDLVKITEQKGEMTVLVRIEVAPKDLGYVIGKEGKVINSIRAILKAVAAKNRKRLVVELIE